MFQRWSQSNCVRSGLVSILFLCLGVSTHATVVLKQTPSSKQTVAPSHQKSLPPLLQQVESKYTKSATLSANFTQITEDKTYGRKKKSSGHIFIKRPLKIRWETFEPDASILVSDSRRYWFYTPPFEKGERGQVIEKPSSQVQSKLANALLSGSFSTTRDMAIRQINPSTFVLTPKKGTAGTVTQAQIEIDTDQQLIQKVILTHAGGNRAEISLAQIELGKDLPDNLFVFTPPPDTDRVEGKE